MKWFFGSGIVAAAVIALYFIIQLDLNAAVLSMLALFTLTNGARAASFTKQGMHKQAKWMVGASLFFAVVFAGFGIYVLLV